MNSQELFRAGQLADALKALSAEVRDNPTDARRRTFLFELLCFAGDYERADKQLECWVKRDRRVKLGVLLYRSALYAERQRQDLFTCGEVSETSGIAHAQPHGHLQWQAVRLFYGRRSAGLEPGSNFLRRALPVASS